MLESALIDENISDLKLAIKECSVREDVEQYKDRNGLLRRMENFTFKNIVLRNLKLPDQHTIISTNRLIKLKNIEKLLDKKQRYHVLMEKFQI